MQRSLQGPGQYINPITEGRSANGEAKAVLSSQKSTPSAVFGPKPTHPGGRSLIKPGAELEPGPGAYIDPLKEGRTKDGEVIAVLSTQKNLNRVVFGKHKINRDLAKYGAEHEPGPGAYINPLTEGRNANGEVKAILSSQQSVRSATFGPPAGPQAMRDVTKQKRTLRAKRQVDTPGPGAYSNPLTDGRNELGEYKAMLSNQVAVPSIGFGKPGKKDMRSMARTEMGPGPGAYVDPLKEGRTANGEVRLCVLVGEDCCEEYGLGSLLQFICCDRSRLLLMQVKAVLSRHKSTTSVVFGKGNANARSLVQPGAAEVPGPGMYTQQKSMGNQVLSKYKSIPTARWGPPGR